LGDLSKKKYNNKIYFSSRSHQDFCKCKHITKFRWRLKK
jgi:hypothetical protein